MPIKTLGSLGKIRVGRVTGNTHIFFFGPIRYQKECIDPHCSLLSQYIYPSLELKYPIFADLDLNSQFLVENCDIILLLGLNIHCGYTH